MTREGHDEYRVEHAFLIEMKAACVNQLAHRARTVARMAPDLAEETWSLIETPIDCWPRDANRTVVAQLHALKLEESLVDDLTDEIDRRALVDAIERRMARIEQEEVDFAHDEPVGRYLFYSAYWRDEDALDALNNIFKNWARWCRSEPLEVP